MAKAIAIFRRAPVGAEQKSLPCLLPYRENIRGLTKPPIPGLARPFGDYKAIQKSDTTATEQ